MRRVLLGSFVSFVAFQAFGWATKTPVVQADEQMNSDDKRLGYKIINEEIKTKPSTRTPVELEKAPTQERVKASTDYNWIEYKLGPDQEEPDLETLRQVLFIHRHGDRTPIQFPVKDPLRKDPIWAFYGGGQLTNRGKARLHLLGSMIRDRYDNFLNNSVNKNLRISRSSGALRCLESAQVFLSSFLGMTDSEKHPDAKSMVWNDTQLAQIWQPAHIQSMPAKFDGLLAEGSVCDNLEREYTEKVNQTAAVKQLFKDYEREVNLLRRLLGYKMEHFREFFWASSQIEVESSYFPNDVNPELIAAFPRIEEAGHKAMTFYQSTLLTRRLRAGLLIDHWIKQMKAVRDYGDKPLDPLHSDVKPFVHYSAHDLNIVVILGIFDNWMKFQKRPDYASNMMLELHRDKKDDEWFIKIFYMPKVPADLIELHIPDCELGHPMSRCTLDKFEEIMKIYAIPSWQKWMSECDNSYDKIDPYEPGQ